MDDATKLQALEQVARKLSINIEVTRFEESEIQTQSGHCKLRGQDLILLDRNLTPKETIEIFLTTFLKFDLENVYLPAWLREEMDARQSSDTNQ
ncbi:MAG: hypothetical protein G3M78_13640 [Candidatus Nitrohelix vancouverensis]|uniref:Uncharacterized protein n=1 Tax=Candidatus Nitrohelix vancouverensis TaxID=2705534 RepID=A0A7T0G4D6_9BACT|nr:MAG: hypothetical protein G3M78_13640 [Candidatus Nitrohelix vancouverensis]